MGIDHGTQSMRFCALSGDGREVNFEIGRREALKKSILREIEERVPFTIDMVGMAYSMGDGIDAIVDLHKVENRGLLEKRTGDFVGGGTKVFDEIYNSKLRAVLIPGLHRGIACLDPRFKALYSHCAAADKVSLSYHAFLEVNKDVEAKNLIISDISSNTVTIGIKDGKFFGAIDACLGAIGILHGPLDLETIRRVDRGETTANEAFYSSGAIKIFEGSSKNILNQKTEEARLALESLILSAKMEIYSLLDEVDPEAIVITGSAGIHDNVYNQLENSLQRFTQVFNVDGFSAAKGGAEIARAVLGSKTDILGIPIKR